jgi:flavin-dependent dehydrogenase
MSVVCVIGGGPAGSTFAARMAQLGHEVWLVERTAFPRRHLGEALTPGVLPLLEMTGARATVEEIGHAITRVHVTWADGPRMREESRPQGSAVDRGAFDRALLEHARKLGVRVLQPATVRARVRSPDGWNIAIDTAGGVCELRADLLADATGRAAGSSSSRRWTGAATLALYAYWRGRGLPEEPRIEAGADAWYWGVPLPDGSFNTLVFVDARAARAEGATLAERFKTLLSRSRLFDYCRGAELVGAVSAVNATPYLDRMSATKTLLKVGDAALALDPLSSSGVQKAIQGALSAAVAANTILRRPETTDAALRFYRDMLAAAAERHCRWAASRYGEAASRHGGAFWRARAGQMTELTPAPQGPSLNAAAFASAIVALSDEVEFVDQPCIVGEFVAVRQALRHPALDGPLAYLGGLALVPLLRGLPAGLTPLEIARSWSDRLPLDRGLAIVGWMLERGLFIPLGSKPTRAGAGMARSPTMELFSGPRMPVTLADAGSIGE